MNQRYCIAAVLFFVALFHANSAFCERIGVEEAIVANVVEDNDNEGEALGSVKSGDFPCSNKMNRKSSKDTMVNKQGNVTEKIRKKHQASWGKVVSLFRKNQGKKLNKRKESDEVAISRSAGRVRGAMRGSYRGDDVKEVYNPNKFFDVQHRAGIKVDVLGREENIKNVISLPGLPGTRPERSKDLLEENLR